MKVEARGFCGRKTTLNQTIPFRLSLFSTVCALWTLSLYFFSLTVTETLKWLTLLSISMRNHSGGLSVELR